MVSRAAERQQASAKPGEAFDLDITIVPAVMQLGAMFSTDRCGKAHGEDSLPAELFSIAPIVTASL